MKTDLVIYFLLYNFLIVAYCTESSDDDVKHFRSLYTSKRNIYYSPPFSKVNNITGTGNMFKDNAYRAICMSLNCVSSCCNENINIMVCGQPDECLEYNDYGKAWKIAIIVTLSVLIPFGVILGIVQNCNNKRETCYGTIFLALAVMGLIIFFPIVLIVMLVRCIINRDNKPNKNAKVR
jgi:hypothetical protein